ncbi:CBH1, partial [Symbiodinium pilosum]
PGHSLFNYVDVSLPFTINTSFVTDNGAANGTLVDIIQIISQNGDQKARLSFAERLKADAQEENFRPDADFIRVYGGLAQMGEALRRGMVMVLALWADPSGNMNWLDSCHGNKSVYDCSKHPKFDDSVWEQAHAAKPGIWRGPADFFPDYETSYKTKDVFFNYPGIPPLIRSQVRFGCRGCETPGSLCDCSGVPYQFSISNIQAKHRLIPNQPEPTEKPDENANHRPNLVWKILIPAVSILV